MIEVFFMSEIQLNPPTVSLYTEQLMLKILLKENGLKKFLQRNGYRDDDIAMALGLPEESAFEEDMYVNVQKLLQRRYKQIEQLTFTADEHWQQAYQNLAKIQKYLGLSEIESQLLRFSLHIDGEPILESTLDLLGNMDMNKACAIMANLLNLNKSAVVSALKKQGKLKAYGLIAVEYRCYSSDVDDYIDWGNTIDINDFIVFELNESTLLNKCLKVAPSSTLQWTQFEHIADMRKTLLDYLSSSIQQQRKGCNIFLYGLPGTGKTELALLLAQQLNLACYCLHYQDDDGDAINGERRLNNCHLAQKLLAKQPAIIIFDEVEDIFASSFFSRSVAQEHKAWMNDFLENNSTPMIWISNQVQGIDPAYLRRFDLIFEMPNLPNHYREKLILEKAGENLSPQYVHYLAQIQDLSPAVLTRGIEVVNQLKTADQHIDFSEKLLTVFNQTLQAQGYKKVAPLNFQKLEYNLDYVNCQQDLAKISEGLLRTKQGRICCYGPAGTGKTAWAEWLAQQLEMPLLRCQGSDLLGKYVGETEQKIAQSFERAKENNMLLVFDEVDTFLFAREAGQPSWEHSKVNEMLTQIERFEGLMVVSTNLMEGLDPAALRRFDLKLHFDYLQSEQLVSLAKQQLIKLALPELDPKTQQKLTALEALTLGDFAAIARQHRFAPFSHTEDWVQALQRECELKGGKPKISIGF